MEPLDPRASQLLEQIASAFRGVTLGDGVSLHETEVLDNYGNAEQRRAARAPDEKLDWRKLIDHPDLQEVQGIGGIAFFDELGLRFHLPAYMSLAIMRPRAGVVESLLYYLLGHPTMTRRVHDARFSMLDDGQRAAVRAFLEWWRDGPTDEFDEPGLSESISGYWSQSAAERDAK